ncbi:MAG: hypothetical protein ACR2J3_02905 [Aridibacter sp.]
MNNKLIIILIRYCHGVDDLLGLWQKEYGTEEAVRRCLELFDKAKVFDEKEKLNQATRILRFAENLELFHTADQKTFATIETDGHEENHRLNTKAFREYQAELIKTEEFLRDFFGFEHRKIRPKSIIKKTVEFTWSRRAWNRKKG